MLQALCTACTQRRTFSNLVTCCQTQIDISEAVVSQMRELHAHIPQLSYQIGDVTSMEFTDCSFGSALDKGASDCGSVCCSAWLRSVRGTPC